MLPGYSSVWPRPWCSSASRCGGSSQAAELHLDVEPDRQQRPGRPLGPGDAHLGSDPWASAGLSMNRTEENAFFGIPLWLFAIGATAVLWRSVVVRAAACWSWSPLGSRWGRSHPRPPFGSAPAVGPLVSRAATLRLSPGHPVHPHRGSPGSPCCWSSRSTARSPRRAYAVAGRSLHPQLRPRGDGHGRRRRSGSVVPTPVVGGPASTVPVFFTSGGWEKYVDDGSVLAVPPPDIIDMRAVDWQATAGWRFPLVEATSRARWQWQRHRDAWVPRRGFSQWLAEIVQERVARQATSEQVSHFRMTSRCGRSMSLSLPATIARSCSRRWPVCWASRQRSTTSSGTSGPALMGVSSGARPTLDRCRATPPGPVALAHPVRTVIPWCTSSPTSWPGSRSPRGQNPRGVDTLDPTAVRSDSCGTQKGTEHIARHGIPCPSPRSSDRSVHVQRVGVLSALPLAHARARRDQRPFHRRRPRPQCRAPARWLPMLIWATLHRGTHADPSPSVLDSPSSPRVCGPSTRQRPSCSNLHRGLGDGPHRCVLVGLLRRRYLLSPCSRCRSVSPGRGSGPRTSRPPGGEVARGSAGRGSDPSGSTCGGGRHAGAMAGLSRSGVAPVAGWVGGIPSAFFEVQAAWACGRAPAPFRLWLQWAWDSKGFSGVIVIVGLVATLHPASSPAGTVGGFQSRSGH